MFLFQKLCAIRKIIFRRSKYKHETIEMGEMLKTPTVNPLFKYKFVLEKWINCPHLSINEKNLQKVGLKGNIN